ncbi:BlaI/MecI/CopY family transcriptional regulator [Paenibacillus rhizoplanae]
MEPYKLYDAEYKFACLIWDHEPINSTELVKLSLSALGWKKSTTYTVLRKLCERGILRNEGGGNGHSRHPEVGGSAARKSDGSGQSLWRVVAAVFLTAFSRG